MKRTSGTLALITTTLVLLATHPALAATYKAECLSDEGEFTSCKVKVQQNRFRVTYQSSEHRKSNVNISSQQIVQMFRRKYSKEKRRSFLSSALGVAFSTLISEDMRQRMGLSSQDSEETHAQIGVAYVDGPLTAEVREALLQERGSEDFEVEDEDLEENAVGEQDLSQEDEGDIEEDTDEDDTQQFEEEDAQQVKTKTSKRKKNLSTRLAKKAIIFDVGDERDAFALRQELKASTGLEFDQE